MCEKKNDNMFFREKLENPERKSLMGQCHWNEIDFPTSSKHWEKFEPNDKTIALNLLLLQKKNGGLKKNKTRLHFKTQFRASRITNILNWKCPRKVTKDLG